MAADTAEMQTGFVFDPIFLEHETGTHPENASRMTNTMRLLGDCGLLSRLERIEVRAATSEELSLAHDPSYVQAVSDAAASGGGWVDPDTLITRRSYDVAAHVVGGTLNAVDAVVLGKVRSAYCLVRPPGHHATPVQAMGFCLFNHVAVAAVAALSRHELERVAIIDWDVHHGNGTQDRFYDDGRVLYISTHEYPFYPGTGSAEEVGSDEGVGTTINIPMPHGSGDAEHVQAFQEIIVPALRRFRPELLLVSSGFDAHFADDIAMQRVSVDGYGELARLIVDAASELCDGRLLMAQEGGYHETALPWCVRRTIETMLGDVPTPDPLGFAPASAPPATFKAMLEHVRTLHGL